MIEVEENSPRRWFLVDGKPRNIQHLLDRGCIVVYAGNRLTAILEPIK